MRRVVVTGLGTMNPLGNNVADTWENVKKGVCGIGPITRYDTSDKKVKLAGEIKDFDAKAHPDAKALRRMDRYSQYAYIAAHEAVKDAGLDFEGKDTRRYGVMVASGIGGIDTIETEDHKGAEKGYDKVSPFFIPMSISNMAAGHISMAFGLHGMSSCVVTACASGTNAIGDAFHYVRDGYADLMITGGSEAAITDLSMGGFTSLSALSRSEDPNRASIPFDKERNGFVMGEGAGILIFEELEHAKARGAKIYCEVTGYGATCDANHMTAPLEDGSMAAECMKMALEDGKTDLNEVDYINAHGTSTPLNDKCETMAVKTLFGDHAKELMISSTKSMTGHMLGATGAVEALIMALSIHDGFVPATINYKVPDEDCDLDIVPNEGRKADIKVALSNTFGFGGHNATIVMKKY